MIKLDFQHSVRIAVLDHISKVQVKASLTANEQWLSSDSLCIVPKNGGTDPECSASPFPCFENCTITVKCVGQSLTLALALFNKIQLDIADMANMRERLQSPLLHSRLYTASWPRIYEVEEVTKTESWPRAQIRAMRVGTQQKWKQKPAHDPLYLTDMLSVKRQQM